MGKAFFLSSKLALGAQINNCEAGGTRPSRDLYVKSGNTRGGETKSGTSGRRGSTRVWKMRGFAGQGRSGKTVGAEATVCV